MNVTRPELTGRGSPGYSFVADAGLVAARPLWVFAGPKRKLWLLA